MTACTTLAVIGRPVTKPSLLDATTGVVTSDTDERKTTPPTMKTVDGVIRRNPELLKVVSASPVEPERADQANKETHEAFFKRLDNFCYLLYRLELSEYKSYRD